MAGIGSKEVWSQNARIDHRLFFMEGRGVVVVYMNRRWRRKG